MAGIDAISAERVRDLFVYDAKTGNLFSRRLSRFVGSADPDGYRVVSIDGKRCFVHRVVWLHQTGSWPSSELDHINGVRDDNRIENLREVSRRENKQNTKSAHKDSRSGYLGVSARRGKWRAQIMHEGRNKFLGTFDAPEQAHAAYLAAKRELHKGYAGALPQRIEMANGLEESIAC